MHTAPTTPSFPSVDTTVYRPNPSIANDPAAVRAKLVSAWRFTEAYRSHLNDHPAVREAACIAEQYPALCREIREHDLIAGRVHYLPLVGFSLEHCVSAHPSMGVVQADRRPDASLSAEERRIRETYFTSYSGFCLDYASLRFLGESASDPADAEAIRQMIAFWTAENTTCKYRHALPEELKKGFGRVTRECQYASTFFRVCCLSVDYDVLLQAGIPGLRQRIAKRRERARGAGEEVGLLDGMDKALDVLVSVCEHYRLQALAKLKSAYGAERAHQLQRLAEALGNIQTQKPASLFEAMQLFWLWNLMAGTVNFGRMDVYLGDFYARDIARGLETTESAQALLGSLWRIISEQAEEGNGSYRFNARIVVGGRGRRNEPDADRFALAAMEATRRLKRCEPTVTLRFYRGQNPALFDKALQCIGEGCVHPTLYNDDRHIPMVEKAYGVTHAEAERYLPQGCGEINIDGLSIGSPNNIINFVTALDLVLHNGYSTETGEVRGLQQGGLESFATFEDLLAAFKRQIDYTNGLFARRHAIEHRIHAENGAYLFISMLMADCIDRNRSCFAGGTRYLGGTIETFGLTNACDSLVAIKELVYDKRLLTLAQAVEACDANFEGHEKVRRMLLAAPKFGNDIAAVDAFHNELSAWLCRNAASKAKAEGLHYLLNCNLNPDGIRYAINTKASPDGRRYGESFAVGCAPTAGRDTRGMTAVLNSMMGHEEPNSGYVHNLKVGHSLFSPENLPAFRSVLDRYFADGGWQLMITVLNPDDLQKALKEPEKYTHIMVRVGGWTARFIDLPPTHQKEILARTLYC